MEVLGWAWIELHNKYYIHQALIKIRWLHTTGDLHGNNICSSTWSNSDVIDLNSDQITIEVLPCDTFKLRSLYAE